MRVAVFGAAGFVGSAIVKALQGVGIEPVQMLRGDSRVLSVDVLVNAACPSRRLDAERRPRYDYAESVVKTEDIFYRHEARRFLQVSSLSARYPENSAYGENRLAAEMVVPHAVIVRLGPMYGDGLTKGVLVDMLAGQAVYADPDTRYSFADVAWVGRRIAEIALGDRTGILEIGGRGSLSLREIATAINSPSPFLPSAFLRKREDQVLPEPRYIGEEAGLALGYADPLDEGVPDSRLVLPWLIAKKAA